ncbi:MAG: alpha/beta hydrolase [Acetobacteraceae bacterium]|nr:alpha/beta hydrolase [Acetobacteraceae bacterium]
MLPADESGAAMQRRIGILERPDCRIHYEVAGEGPVLVFAHGLGGNHMSWWQQVAHFAQGYTCVTFAHRGFWPSSPVEGGPDPQDYAADLDALCDALGIEEFALICQSMGGWTGIEYALLRTGRLAGLVLAATTGSIGWDRLGRDEELAAWRRGADSARAACLASGVHPACGLRMAEEQPALHLLYRQVDEANRALDKEGLRARLGAARTRAPEELAAAGCPILLIGNAEDVVMPPFAAEAIAAKVPGARHAMIERAGHSAYFERAAAFNAILDAFIGGE